MPILQTPPMLWLLVLIWAIAAGAFLSKVDRLKLAILVILLSLLMVVFMVRGRASVPPAKPVILPVSPGPATTTT